MPNTFSSPRAAPAALLALTAGVLLPGSTAPTSRVEVTMELQRNTRGLFRLCLTRAPAHFPNCDTDPDALSASISAATRSLTLPPMEPGTYALSVMHDENGNGRLDTVLGIPKEGFGFSRNPSIGFGPPKFDAVRFVAEPGTSRQTVRLRYLL